MDGSNAAGSDQIYDRVKTHKGIESALCMDKDGNHIRPPKGFDDEESATEYGKSLNHLLERAVSACRDLDPTVSLIIPSTLPFHPSSCLFLAHL
jgi:hypothetical protein